MKHLLLLLVLMPLAALAQVRTFPADTTSIPKNQKGKLVGAVGYADKNGKHLVWFRETGVYDLKDYRAAELFAYQQTDAKQDWRVSDGFTDCELDILGMFMEKKPLVTDLDKNGIAEVWMIYRTSCTGDISPPLMKVIMYEGKTKYAMRGQARFKSGDYDLGGAYKFDSAFLSAPASYREYAKKLWAKHVNFSWQ